jgi:hypothetical protein
MKNEFHGNINHKLKKNKYKDIFVLEKQYLNNTEQTIRYNRELKFYEFCAKNNILNVPNLLESTNNTLIIQFIEGSPIRNVNNENLFLFYNFLAKLNNHKNNNLINNLPIAAEAILESKDLIINIEKRIKQVGLVGKYHPNKFKNIVNTILNEAVLVNHDIGVIIANPSDFGVHNTLFYSDQLYFFDFEYAGKDSLLKCIMDFILHPANNINIDDMDKIVNSFSIAIGENDFKIKNITKQCFIIWWVLRLLNSISYNTIEYKIKNNLLHKVDKDSFINQRLQLINKFINYITLHD